MLYKINNLDYNELKCVTLWFLHLCECVGQGSLNQYDIFQQFYFSLVRAFGLRDHSRQVMNLLLNRAKNDGTINPAPKSKIMKFISPCYDYLSEYYAEDKDMFEVMDEWDSNNEDEINLMRLVYNTGSDGLRLLVLNTFFFEPGTDENKFFIRSSTYTFPKKESRIFTNTDIVKVFSDPLGLSQTESLILKFVYYRTTLGEFKSLINCLCYALDYTAADVLSICLDINKFELNRCLGTSGKLIEFGILDCDCDIHKDAVESIYSNNLRFYFRDIFKDYGNKRTYPLESFSVPHDETELVLRFLKNSSSANILLYGAPGSGKTEYARSLVKKSGLKPFVFRNEYEIENGKNGDIKSIAKLNCHLALEADDSVIIIDEAESLLETGGDDFFSMLSGGTSSIKKATVNKMLENSNKKVIWILNYTSSIDTSTLRRFTYSIRFNEMSRENLKRIAISKIRHLRLSDTLTNQVVDLCGKYNVTGASVDNIVKTVMSLNGKSVSEDSVINDVTKVLKANASLLHGNSRERKSVKSNYDLSILNTSTPAEDIVKMVENATSYAEKHKGGAGENGVRMLFYGLSGTGKTELARFIADRLGKKLILKSASDILASHVGESEQNVKMAFEQAEQEGAVLLFDEADSFFADRNTAAHSWERTLVNEFLTQMEEFSGILICTTNLRKIMDSAMQRRFDIMCEFKPMEKSGIEKLLEKYFDPLSFSASQIEKLQNFGTVTPGDFASLSGRVRFIDESKITSDYVVAELSKMQEEKEGKVNRVGFCA